MKIIKSLSEVGSNEKIALTIGNFDGVHRGHQKLFKTLNEICGKKNLKSAVITFLPHPKRILFPDNIFFMINSYAERRELISELNIDYLVELDFTRDFSTLKPGEFIDHYIIAPHCVKEFYIGYDFVFGANKKGGYDILSEVCKKNNICMTVQEEFLFQGNTVSSSTIRQKIATGKLDVVSDLLGRNFFLSGIIIKGEGRGRQIGFPTANMELTEDRLIPEKGVYITKTSIGNMVYESVTSDQCRRKANIC